MKNVKEIAIKHNLSDTDFLNDLRQFGVDKFNEGFNYSRQRNDWIPVSERLPGEIGSYLVSTTNMGVMVVHFEQGEFISDFGKLNVTAWQAIEDYDDRNL